jgi:hypothetical protein
MIAQKTVRFFLKYASSDPLNFAHMLGRRAIDPRRHPPVTD